MNRDPLDSSPWAGLDGDLLRGPGLPAFAAETDRFRHLRAPFRVVRRHHRIGGRQIPLRAVIFRGHAVWGRDRLGSSRSYGADQDGHIAFASPSALVQKNRMAARKH